ncbi:DUF4435 domain-containing protein [Clostridium botulinum]|uniref:DUF4435 domain-containing protein n=1 Tax=Clostridium botulinum TaxID=1491 RepID=UPI00077431A8|nr:DUF4435 domain-containing protein [Clostridium botulinum]NFL87394.1 DUF4435 domain-containing protein [Clostridium botulinum]NFO21731.1 DUF4435 domain-containing protein [Clostridium botulinum]
MKDRKEYMKSKRKSPQVILTRFYKQYKPNEKCLNIFVEGIDDITYYYPKFKDLCEDIECIFYDSGGKKNVLKIYEKLNKNEKYSNNKLAYIIDRDYDDSIASGIDNMYETPCYAVENFYTSIDVFKRILKCPKWFQYIEGEQNYNEYIELFKNFNDELHNSLLLLNSWMCYQRKIENKYDQQKKLNIDSVDKDCFVSIDLKKGVKTKYNMEYIKRYYINAYECIEEDLQLIKEKFISIDKQKFFRGKHELFYFIKFLNKLIEENNKQKSNKRIKNSISENDAIEKLTAYADFPTDLRSFINCLNDAV